MTSTRTIATVTGMLFLITFITAIAAAFVLYPPVLNDPTYRGTRTLAAWRGRTRKPRFLASSE